MNRAQSKFHNTSIKMQNALVQLLDEKSFNNISVSDICKKAEVNRSTFYSHYENVYELLKEIQSDSIKAFETKMNKQTALDNIDYKEHKDLVFITHEYLIPYLEFIKTNKKLYNIYMDNFQIFNGTEYENNLINSLLPVMLKSINDKNIADYMLRYFLGGINNIIKKWIDHDCEDDILLICEIIISCVLPNGI
ncbi:MAG: TetR/AcrR family transcriptional regulator [Clostridia bacterium]|nr:TetR/AcrR family transcriptional regulator [Clostridia bacterium]